MKARTTPNAIITQLDNGWRLGIPAGDSRDYRLAELDDYFQLPRRQFPHHSLTLSLRAKASSDSIPGTWGFGLWNDPFGMSLGFGGNPFRLPVLPNAVWFFHASPQNYLSFRDPSTSLRSVQGVAAQGFLAQTFRSPSFHPLLIPAGLALPFSRKAARKMLGRVIGEDGVAVSLDVTQWHGYRLEWSPKRVLFEVDNVKVLETSMSPRSPLGVVIWIDNQFAAFTPEGKIGFGVLENPEPAWIEICDLEVRDPAVDSGSNEG
jgi:hypothetical protein